MTRRHDERWAVPIGPDEYIHSLEEEFFRLRQVERTQEATIDFLRSERDRLKDGAEELVRELNDVRLEINRLREAARPFAKPDDLTPNIGDVEALRASLGRIADPEVYDLDARAMRRDAEAALADGPTLAWTDGGHRPDSPVQA